VTATPRKRFYHFSYLRQPVSHEGPRIYELRDGDAFAELQPVLFDLGYEYGGLLLNQRPEAGSELLPRLSRDDLIVLTTRPPITDDGTMANRKFIERTDGDLEKAILNAARPVFEICNRKFIRLTEHAAAGLPPAASDRAEVEFRVYKRGGHEFAYYYRLRNAHAPRARSRTSHAPTHAKTTSTFLLRTPIGPNGPMLLNAFGMDGVTTLVWCYLLRTKYSRLLGTPGFTMAEIAAGELPRRPLDLAFADRWRVRLLLAPDGGAAPKRDSRDKRISSPNSIGARSALRK
jgi:hypothetical protein